MDDIRRVELRRADSAAAGPEAALLSRHTARFKQQFKLSRRRHFFVVVCVCVCFAKCCFTLEQCHITEALKIQMFEQKPYV